ncbi:ArsC family reductase [Amphritea sp. 1_MG-2023]|uniref:ArsC family reductase n=1 Tax=Amphritea sp. 1_MG-2023 TaxID=3062670 RepID=UPI0026E45BDD|nr:ArsC family reductase [Amphritea sp. 1_MG-2023]MDO6562675.1 ArsC family reductase [Amphritea sp. 1_MG-2023]
MITLYGIPNCDTVKKAQRWLTANHLDFSFHDLRKDGLSERQLREWVSALGWEALLNKRSTSWRALSDEIKTNIDEAAAIREMLATPTLIKRPVLSHDGSLLVGFKESDYGTLLP